MLVSKTVLVERVFSIYVTDDDGETWNNTYRVFGILQCAIDFCNENNEADADSSYIAVPSDRTDASVTSVL